MGSVAATAGLPGSAPAQKTEAGALGDSMRFAVSRLVRTLNLLAAVLVPVGNLRVDVV